MKRSSIFKNEINNYVLTEFASLNISYKLKNTEEDLLNLFTLQEKIAYPFKRKVDVSLELRQKLRTKNKENEAIHYLIYCLKNCLNINNFQSRELFNYRVHDKLVYDWCIFHFHLSLDEVENDYFTKRTKKVLFVYIDKERALLLDTDKHEPPHTVFAEKKWLEIIDNNWKDVLHYANDIIDLAHHYTTEERKFSRKHNINEAILKVNGRFVSAPGLGFVGDGKSASVMLKFNRFIKWLIHNEKYCNNNKININELKLIFESPYPKIIYKNTGKIFANYI